MSYMLNSDEEKIRKSKNNVRLKNTSNGITIVALVVTIILLLILSTVSIQGITKTGLFEKANMAKLENKRGQITEWLNLKLYETQSESYNKTAREIIELTRQNVEKDKSQLEKMGKNVNIDSEISTEEDGEQVGPYFYVIVDKDIYKVSMEEQKFIGEDGKLLPVIKLISISNTSNSITVKIRTSRNEGGKLKYYIKEYDASDYTLVKELEDETYTYEGLKQGVKYSVKIVAENANKLTSEVVGEQTTGTVIDLKEGDLEFTSKPSTWTNTNVKVTVKANIDTKGYKLQTSKDGKKWDNTTTQICSTNGYVYARLWDGTNYGGTATGNVENIDKTKPQVGSATATTNSITINATDEASGIIGYALTTTNTEPTEFTVVSNRESLEVTVEKQKQETTYYVWVKDQAGNISEGKTVTTGKVTDLTVANVKFTYSPSGWTNKDVTATASTTVTGYTLQTSKDGNNWENKATQTYSSNGYIYARLWDGTNFGATATGNFTNIDKTAPTVSTALKTTSSGTNSVALSIGVTDTNSGLGKIDWYYGTTNNPTTKAGTTSITAMNTNATGPTTAQTKTYTATGLATGTTYYFKAVVYDVAGNQVSSTIISAKTNVVSKDIGDEVTVGGEQFYVLNWDNNLNTVDLISKYNLNTEGTAQQDASYITTACAFSSTDYWSNRFTSSPFNLNDFDGYTATDAIGKAKSYGRSKGAVSSRLLSYEEAEALKSKASSNTKIDTMLWGKANTANGWLRYWLGSARSTNYVWFVNGYFDSLSSNYISDGYFGVRPVITVLKSKIS